MSDLRFESGRRAAIMAGLVGAMVAPLVITAPAKAANITKSHEWRDGEPTYEFPSSIVENGVTYRLISQSNPVVIDNGGGGTHTFREQRRTATLTRTANGQYPAAAAHPESLFPQTINVNEGGVSGTLTLSSITSVTAPVAGGTREEARGATEAQCRQKIPADAINVSSITSTTEYGTGDLVYVATYTLPSAGESTTWTAVYPSVTVSVSGGSSKRWSRSATYQSIDTAVITNQPATTEQPAPTVDPAEEQRKREEAERAARDAEVQAKAMEDAKTQSNQLINSIEETLRGEDAQYVSEDTKTQAQGAIDQLRQAMNGNDLVTINTAQGSLRQISDRINQEITVAKGENPSDSQETPDLSFDSRTSTNKTSEPDDDTDTKNEAPSTTPRDPDEVIDTEQRQINLIPIAAGIIGLVAAGGVITGVVVSKSKKKAQPQQQGQTQEQQQAFDENGNPIDPTMVTAAGIAVAGAGIAGAGVAGAGVADAMTAGEGEPAEFVSNIVVPPAVDELADIALIPGYVPVVDSQCQLFAYLSDEENKSVLTTGATISPADDIPTLIEIPVTEEDNPFVAAWVEDDGSYRLATDENGEVVYQLNEDGTPMLDEDGNPVPEILIPDYILVLPAEDIEKAVSQNLLVYSDDGQEIFRGEIGEYTIVDTGTLWGVINEQIPEEERTDIIDEISVYVSRLDEIDENNDALVANYEAERQAQIEAQEQEYAEWQMAQDAAMMTQAESENQIIGDEFDMATYQDAGLAAMGEYGVDATNFTEVTDGIDDFGQPGMEYDPMGVTGDGFIEIQPPYDGQDTSGYADEAYAQDDAMQGETFQEFQYDGGESTPMDDTEGGYDDFQPDELPDQDFQEFQPDGYSDDFQDALPGDDDFEEFQETEQDDFEALPPNDADGYGNYDYATQTDDYDDFEGDDDFASDDDFEDDDDFANDDDFEDDDDFASDDDFEGDDDFDTADDFGTDEPRGYGNAYGEDLDETDDDDFAEFDTFGDEDDMSDEDEPMAMPSYSYAPEPEDEEDDFSDFDDFDDFDDDEDEGDTEPEPEIMAMPSAGDYSNNDTDEFFAGPLTDDDFSDFADFDDFDDDADDVTSDETPEETEEAPEEEEPKPAPRIKIPERKRNRKKQATDK